MMPFCKRSDFWLRSFSVAIAVCLLPTNGTALESDQSQPINIRADSGVIDDSTGKSTYQGNVSIDQGSLLITAELLEIYLEDRDPIRIVATGNREALAYYEQIPEPGDEPVIANASEITYLIEEEKLILKGSAEISQNDYFFAGEEIQYDISKGIINANSKNRRGQVRMTISPRDDSDP